MERKSAYLVILRYTVLLLLTLTLPIFYFILKPVTIAISGLLLGLFYDVFILNDLMVIGEHAIRIVPACIAGSAYVLLLILGFATPMEHKKRYLLILFSFISFFVINVIRILIFSVLFVKDFKYFDLAHSLTWHIFSTIIVILIWFLFVKIFKINSIPIYSDIRYIYSLTSNSKKPLKNLNKTPRSRKKKPK